MAKSYQVHWLETRVGEDTTDDVALFDVRCEGSEQSWRVPVFLSPLFRFLCMGFQPAIEDRRRMVAGLGAQAIVERLQQGQELPFEAPVVLGTNYPGSPGDPQPLEEWDSVVVSAPAGCG